MTARRRRIASVAAALAAIAAFVALGVWQLERREWKLALIARVDARLAAAPVAAPPPATWPRISADAAYTRVVVYGRFLPVRPALVQAVTERGPGFWQLVPFADARGFTMLVNRGFVDAAHCGAVVPGGTMAVTGLLRISEPRGGFLRANAPGEDRWYSRDVAAIAASRAVVPAAPYFIDADATPNAGGWPIGGLTVVRFRNAHLSYALTWFALAAGLAGALGWQAWSTRR